MTRLCAHPVYGQLDPLTIQTACRALKPVLNTSQSPTGAHFLLFLLLLQLAYQGMFAHSFAGVRIIALIPLGRGESGVAVLGIWAKGCGVYFGA